MGDTRSSRPYFTRWFARYDERSGAIVRSKNACYTAIAVG